MTQPKAWMTKDTGNGQYAMWKQKPTSDYYTERGKYIDTPSIDRIIPSLGYTKGNIQIVCYWYNVAKFTWKESLFIEMCRKITENNATK